MDIAIGVDGLWKVFGPPQAQQEARRLLTSGVPVETIRGRTGAVVAVCDVSLEIAAGECFVIMGLSGSGKSTLLRCLNGLILPTAGTVTIRGIPLHTLRPSALRMLRRQHTAMVFQSFALLPHRTVLDNAAFGLEVRGEPPARRQEKAMEALERVGLAGWASARPHELSGGMRQRVGLARALATEAPILLMDEPFSALDPLIRREMQDDLIRLQRDLRRTIVFVTHDPNEAVRIGDRIAILRQGRVLQIGTPEELLRHPRDEYVARFLLDVDRSRALTVGQVARPTPVVRVGTPPSEARAMLAESGAEVCLVVDQLGRLLGRWDRAQLAEARGAVPPTSALSSIPADLPLSEAMHRLAEELEPLAVLSRSEEPIGIVSLPDVVEALRQADLGKQSA